MHQKLTGGRAPPEPTGGIRVLPPDALAGTVVGEVRCRARERGKESSEEGEGNRNAHSAASYPLPHPSTTPKQSSYFAVLGDRKWEFN